jgi:hypothetical protein
VKKKTRITADAVSIGKPHPYAMHNLRAKTGTNSLPVFADEIELFTAQLFGQKAWPCENAIPIDTLFGLEEPR